MTVTDQPADAASAASVAEGALEMGRVDSHLHPLGSFSVDDHPVPTGREEIWRFTPLKRLHGLHADAVLTGGASGADGGLATSWTAPEGITVATVGGDEARALRGVSGLVPNTLVSARVLAEVPETLLVDVPAEAEVSEPVMVELSGTDASSTAGSHVVLRFGHHSSATVVLNHTGSTSLAQVVEVTVGDGARVTVVSLQDWADDAVHLSHQQAGVGRDAAYKHVAVTFGGSVVRLDANVSYDGPGGAAELLGLYFADAGQHLEHRLFADHTAPRTKSNVVYKGALQGDKARTVWVGNVLIRKVAEGIETYEENRNLVLTDGCQADSVPNLEIETGEIEGAGHASTVGRFDDLQLFYLRSRGISEEEARRLVIFGFFNDLIRKVGVPELEDQLMRTVESELERNVLAGYAPVSTGPTA